MSIGTFGRCFALALLLMGWSIPQAAALDPNRSITQYVIDTWRGEHGLPNNSVITVFQTTDRYLWLGTNGGLARFDGIKFVKIGVGQIEGGVVAVCEDLDNVLWIAAQSGVLAQMKNGILTLHEGPSPGYYITTLHAARDGSLWIATLGSGVYRFANGRYEKHEPLGATEIFAIIEDRSGALWMGGRGSGLLRLTDGRWTRYDVRDGLADNTIHALCEDASGALWIGTARGLSRLQGDRFNTFTQRDGLTHDTVTALHQDEDDNLWIGTQAGGLQRLFNGRFTTLTRNEGLADDHVRAIFEDQEKNLWVGTANGLNRLGNGRFVTYGGAEGLIDPTISALVEGADGDVLVGTETSGLFRIKDGKVERLGVFGEINVLAIHERRDGSLWVSTGDSRLLRLKSGIVIDETPRYSGIVPKISHMFDDGTELVFACSTAGLGRVRNRKFQLLDPDAPRIHFVFASHRDRHGTLWLGTSQGLVRIRSGEHVSFTTKEGLPEDRVRSIAAEDDGTLWLATMGGLCRFRNGEIRSVTTSDGLPDNLLRVVLDDALGNLWLSSLGHVFRLSKSELADFFDGRITRITPFNFDMSDGLRTTEVPLIGTYPGFRGRDGRLWFATARGASVVDPTRVVLDTTQPPVVIEEVTVDGVSGRRETYVPGRRRVNITYTALSYRAPARLRFRYKLEGFDEDWVDAGTRRTASYTNLPPRRYVFRVKAANSDGVWADAGDSVSFTLAPYWYETTWFYFVAAVLAIGLVVSAYLWRVAALVERQRKLSQKIEERTADLKRTEEEARALAKQLARSNADLLAAQEVLAIRVKERTADLEAEKERLAVTLRSIGDGVIATDFAGRVVLMNRVAETLTGWPFEEAAGRLLREMLPLMDRDSRTPQPDPLVAVLAGGRVRELPAQTLLVRRDGSEILIADSVAPIRDSASRIVGAVLVFRDVTERRQVEEQLQNAQKLEALGILAGGIAHDFNNLLTGVFGYIDLAQQRCSDYPKASLSKALSVLDKARGLTGQLLTFSRAGQPLTRPLSLKELLEKSTSFALSGSNVVCQTRIPDDLWPCQGDERQIDQVVDNLLLNARQAMPEGGTIELAAENVVAPDNVRIPGEAGRYVRVTIRDHGTGIPPELRSRIFEPFFTTKDKGTGLGLATSFSIIRKHGGHIDVESEPGKGTAFSVYLPASDEPPRSNLDAAIPMTPGKGRILVLDDEDYVRDVAREMLERMGYVVDVARDGEEAESAFAKAHASPRPFDLVILDLTIPGGLGGVTVLKRLCVIDPSIRAVASSGYSKDPIMADPRAYGFVAGLAKPYTTINLGEVVSSVLGKTRA
jgi:PAS domain S-box-containing protein